MYVTGQEGHVFLTSLLMMVVMTFMGIGLMQLSAREFQSARFKTLDSGVFQVTESCLRQTFSWLGEKTSPPVETELPYNIEADDIEDWFLGTETAQMLSKLAGYSYNCGITELLAKTVPSQIGTGEEIGESMGYGIGGNLSPRFFYAMEASGSGPENTQLDVNAIVSVEY